MVENESGEVEDQGTQEEAQEEHSEEAKPKPRPSASAEAKQRRLQLREVENRLKETTQRLEDLEHKYQESQEVAKRLQQAEKLREAREKIASKHGLPADLLRGQNEEELEEHAATLGVFVKRATAPVVGGIGIQPSGRSDDMAGFMKNLLNSR